MHISHSDNTLHIKGGPSIVALHNTVNLGTFEVPGPGEYDVAGTSAIVLPAPSCTAILRIETVSLLYLDRPYKIDPESEDFANIDVVIIRLTSPEDIPVAQQIIKDLEPRAYVLYGLAASEIITTLKLTVEPTSKWTVTANSLPEEGMEAVVLE